MKRADEATVAARTKKLWDRWQHTGSERIAPLSNDELRELLALLETALGVLRGIDGNGHFLTGFILTKQSLEGALSSRLRG